MEDNKPKNTLIEYEHFMTKLDVKYLKVFAIVLMLIHHFWGFPEWVAPENYKYTFTILGYDLEYSIAVYGRICVTIFAFITGYVMCINKSQYRHYSYVLKKIIRFLVSYWMCLLIILLIGVMMGEPMPDIMHLFTSMLGLLQSVNVAYMSCGFSWYVSFFLIVMILSPLIVRIKQNKYVIIKILFMMIMPFILDNAILMYLEKHSSVILGVFETSNFLNYIPYVISGYLIAEYNVYENISNIIGKFICKRYQAAIFSAFIIIILFISRGYCISLLGIPLDIVYCPVTVFCICFIVHNTEAKDYAIIKCISSLSMYIWFLHALFFSPNKSIQFLAFIPHYGVLIIAWVLLMLIPVSYAIKLLSERVIRSLRV